MPEQALQRAEEKYLRWPEVLLARERNEQIQVVQFLREGDIFPKTSGFFLSRFMALISTKTLIYINEKETEIPKSGRRLELWKPWPLRAIPSFGAMEHWIIEFGLRWFFPRESLTPPPHLCSGEKGDHLASISPDDVELPSIGANVRERRRTSFSCRVYSHRPGQPEMA